MRLFVLLTALTTICASSSAQTPVAVKVLDFPRFKLIAGQHAPDGTSPTSGAKLCTLQTKPVCYTMPPEMAWGRSPVEYQFGLDPVSERTPVGGGSVVFFLATFSGGGSGTLERAALLRYQPEGTVVNLLPYVAVTNVGQRQMWRLPEVSVYPILVTADFIWDFAAHETHFSAHQFEIQAYQYDPTQDRYAKAFSYRTAKKYDGGDSSPVNVLKPERAEILRRLAAH